MLPAHHPDLTMKRYPADRHPDSTTVLTHWENLYHTNTVPVSRHLDAISYAQNMTKDVEDIDEIPATLMAFLAELPVEELMHADDRRKGSVLGLLSLAYLLRRQDCEASIRRMLANGDGIAIIRITGDLNNYKVSPELFEDWDSYQAFLAPILAKGDMELGKNSTLL